MRGAIGLRRPAGQQQSQNDTENQLFLLRQANHVVNIMKQLRDGNPAFQIAAQLNLATTAQPLLA